MKILLLAIALLISENTYPTDIETKECDVVRIIDGDTLRVSCEKEPFTRKLRLYCIDAPEKYQYPYSKLAYFELMRLKKIKVNIIRQDLYGRSISEVFDEDNSNINVKLVENGYAAVYPKLCPKYRVDYFNAELKAKDFKLGIWDNSGLHQTPWIYRKERKYDHK